MSGPKGTVVVKVGTSTLTHRGGSLNLRQLHRLVDVLADIKNTGYRVVLVTSGAVGVGVSRLGMSEHPSDLREKQAAAAVGQSVLMSIYSRLFAEYGCTVAQLLLTLDVIENEVRRKNAENTFEKLLSFGVIPIVNENDTISTFEIENMTGFGDNDTLAAVVARLCGADTLILLSDIDGLYDSDPRKDPGARLIKTVTDINSGLYGAAGEAGSARGTGGMSTKLTAAIIAQQGSIVTYICSGSDPDNLYRVLNGENPGTKFCVK